MSYLTGLRIVALVGPDYEDLELQYPKYRMREAGAEVVVAGPEAGRVYTGKHGYPQRAEAAVNDLRADDFHGIIIPGGWAPDKLRRDEDVKEITRRMDAAGKLVAAICHGPWVTISAGVVDGVTCTSSPAITDDLRNAGARWVDQEVVTDGHHVTSRRPDDLPAFCRAMLEVLTAASVAR